MNTRVYMLAHLLCHLSNDDWGINSQIHIKTAIGIVKILNEIPKNARVIAAHKPVKTVAKKAAKKK